MGTRWTDEGHRACPEDRLAAGTQTESSRNRRGNETTRGERVKEGARKARTVSENVAKKQDMDQSQGKFKTHSLWKRRGKTAIVSLNIRPFLSFEIKTVFLAVLFYFFFLSSPIICIFKVTQSDILEKVTAEIR